MLKDEELQKEYLFVEAIGRGAYGRCYMALEHNTENYYACKMWKDDDATKELAIHSQLNHENIVKLVRGFTLHNTSYLLMELCTFGTLSDVLKCRNNLVDCEVCFISKHIASGIIYLHERMIIHRDMKLSNLLLSSNFVVKISDFGFSVQLLPPYQRRLTFCGTNNYIAPELIAGDSSHSFSVDIWAFGCIIYTLLEGKEPFIGKTSEATLRNISKLSYHTPKLISPIAWTFLRTIFIKDQQKRPVAQKLLSDRYFRSTRTVDRLDVTVFYQEPSRSNNEKTRRCLRDVTNALATNVMPKRKDKRLAGKENVVLTNRKEVTMTMKLRPRGGLLMDESVENMLISLQNGGSLLATRLFKLLQECLKCGQSNSVELRKVRSPFICVDRWVAGLKTIGYHTNDGNLAVAFKDLLVYRKTVRGEEEILAMHKDCTLPTREQSARMTRTVRYVERCLEGLAHSGSDYVANGEPAIIVAHKFFPSKSENSQQPIAIFLLSNGSCQINCIGSEKMVVNAYKDMVVVWTPEDSRTARLSELVRFGYPDQLKNKLEFLCYFLRATIVKLGKSSVLSD